MKKLTLLLPTLLLCALGLAACPAGEARIGDNCGDPAADCPPGSNSACVALWPDGYCTEFDCTPGSCPRESICVEGIQFDEVPYESFCMLVCVDDLDCRVDYRCANLDEAITGGEDVCVPTMGTSVGAGS